MKTCSTCKTEKPLSEFNKKGKWYQGKCRSCQKEWYHAYYVNSSLEKNRLARKRLADREEIRTLIHKTKDRPCMDCGIKYPYYVMDFDHRDPGLKKFTIASNAFHWSVQRVKDEILKCDVVCSNCHRIRTHG